MPDLTRHDTLFCPRPGHGPMRPADAPAGEMTARRLECPTEGCLSVASAPVAAFVAPAVRRHLGVTARTDRARCADPAQHTPHRWTATRDGEPVTLGCPGILPAVMRVPWSALRRPLAAEPTIVGAPSRAQVDAYLAGEHGTPHPEVAALLAEAGAR